MKITVTKSVFFQAFDDAELSETWTRSGLGALYDHLDDTLSANHEFDVRETDAAWVEYESARVACDSIGIKYPIDYVDEDETEEDAEGTEQNALRRLRRRVSEVLVFDGGVVVQE